MFLLKKLKADCLWDLYGKKFIKDCEFIQLFSFISKSLYLEDSVYASMKWTACYSICHLFFPSPGVSCTKAEIDNLQARITELEAKLGKYPTLFLQNVIIQIAKVKIWFSLKRRKKYLQKGFFV